MKGLIVTAVVVGSLLLAAVASAHGTAIATSKLAVASGGNSLRGDGLYASSQVHHQVHIRLCLWQKFGGGSWTAKTNTCASSVDNNDDAVKAYDYYGGLSAGTSYRLRVKGWSESQSGDTHEFETTDSNVISIA